MKRSLLLLPLLVVVLACDKTPPSQAESGGNGGGSSVRGGGDDVALEFQNSFLAAIHAVQSHLRSEEILTPKQVNEFIGKAERAKIVVVDKALVSTTSDGRIQYSVATHEPATGSITIHRGRWKAIRNPHIREALALHEIAGLLQLESTGSYPISTKYIKAWKLSSDVLEPVRSRCFAPRNEETSCEVQTNEVTYGEILADSVLTLQNTRTGEVSTLRVDLRAQQVTFADMSKTYTLIVNAPNMASSVFSLTLSIVSEKPTDDPQQFEMHRKTQWIHWRDGKFIPGPLEETDLLKILSGDGSSSGELYNVKDGSRGVFRSSPLANGVIVSSESYGNLNVDMDKARKNTVMKSLVSNTTTKPIEGFSALASFGVPGEIEAKLHAAASAFAARNSKVNEIKAALVKCQENCSSLRQRYEQADLERDIDFMALPARELN